MIHPEDYQKTQDSIAEQIKNNDDNMDYAVYRIVRKDGTIRWVDDYGHYLDTESYGGIYTVFISDITEKHMQMQIDQARHNEAVDAIIGYTNIAKPFNPVELIKTLQKYIGGLE